MNADANNGTNGANGAPAAAEEPRKVQVNLYVSEDELAEIRRAARVDANATAVLAMARLGLETATRNASIA